MDEDTNLNSEQPKEEKKLHFSPLIAGVVFLVVIIILAVLIYTWQKWEGKNTVAPVTPATETMQGNPLEEQQATEQAGSAQTDTNSGGLIMPQNYNMNGAAVPGQNVGPANVPTIAPPGSENIPKGTKEMQYPVPPGVKDLPAPPTPSGTPAPPTTGSANDDEAANYAKQFATPPTPPAVNMNTNAKR